MATPGPSRKTRVCWTAAGGPRIADERGEPGGRFLQLALRRVMAASGHLLGQYAFRASPGVDRRRPVTPRTRQDQFFSAPIGVLDPCRSAPLASKPAANTRPSDCRDTGNAQTRSTCQHRPHAYTGRLCGEAHAGSGLDRRRVLTCHNIDRSLYTGVRARNRPLVGCLCRSTRPARTKPGLLAVAVDREPSRPSR